MKALVAFENVVRLGSVTKAAEELCVTHGAVSKQIAVLEEWFGRPLFEPNRKLMRATAEAQEWAKAVGEALDLLSTATAEARRRGKSLPLRVIAPSTFAARWLIPRLWSFSEERQDIAIQVRHTDSNEAWLDIPFDVAIRSGTGLPSDFHSKPIIAERLTLAISPTHPGAAGLWRPADLHGLKLLSAATRHGELEHWLEAAGISTDGMRVTTFPHFYLALEAALAGAGPLVCPRETLADLLARGALAEPWPQITVAGPTYFALCRADAASDEAISAFMNWLPRVGSAGNAVSGSSGATAASSLPR